MDNDVSDDDQKRNNFPGAGGENPESLRANEPAQRFRGIGAAVPA